MKFVGILVNEARPVNELLILPSTALLPAVCTLIRITGRRLFFLPKRVKLRVI